MFIAILTLLSALSISGVAIFYSVIGLATIFPGAFVPVIIMGSVLEIGKLITASWLYRHWKQCRFLLKTYLTASVVVLSLITSMGIFGFLSKAHLEQNLASENLTQRIELINSKISSQETYILRQNAVIERAEKSLVRTTGSNTEAIEIEKQNLKDVQDKFKTLLTVETNTIKNLNSRLKILDKDVSDVLTAKKNFFNEEKAAAELKASQKEERQEIQTNINEAQGRIAILKEDYTNDADAIQKRIDKLRVGNVDDKSDVNAQIETAEDNIIVAQNTIDDLIIERGPLEKEMIQIEAEVGPVKYIAALVVDWGVTDKVELNEAVRWVILLIIVVFDPLAVALLLAANQSLMRRFPVEPPPPPQEIVDLEKPEPYEPPVEPIKEKADNWNDMVAKANALAEKEKAESIQQEWAKKLDAFNKKVPKQENKPIEFVQKDLQKKTEDKEIVADNEDGFDEDQVKYDLETPTKAEQLEEFKKREEAERQALEDYAQKAREEDPTISEKIEEVMETERTRPDFTEVLEPEVAVKEMMTEPKKVVQDEIKIEQGDGIKRGNLGVRITKDKKVIDTIKPKSEEPKNPAELTEFERTGILNKFHQEHGKFEDISDEVLKKERDDANKAQFLADVALTEEEARNHPPITASRKAFFDDHIDDVLRGNVLAYQLPEETRKTVALILSDYDGPQIIESGSALKEEIDPSIETISTEQLKEKFAQEPSTDQTRDATDDELDELLEGFSEEKEDPNYVQNEEQNDTTTWNKVNLPEAEKNEIELPEIKNTDDIIEYADKDVDIVASIPKPKFTKYKNRIATDEDYHQRIEARIDNLITKLENDEIKLNDLTEEDQKVIMDILNQNG